MEMDIQQHSSPIVASIAASLRRFAFAGLAGGLIALAVAPAARADSATVEQSAGISSVIRDDGQTDAAALNREYLIKAAILFNFAKFASWPDSAFGYSEAPLRVCVLGDDPFGAALNSLNGKQVRNHPLTTARVATLEETPQCHILFVSASEEARLATILDYVGKLPILTVADIGRFANTGGIIALKEVDNRSRIEINLGAAEQAGLKLSSKLLRLANTVSTQAAQDQTR